MFKKTSTYILGKGVELDPLTKKHRFSGRENFHKMEKSEDLDRSSRSTRL
jgi:hypothetical protein